MLQIANFKKDGETVRRVVVHDNGQKYVCSQLEVSLKSGPIWLGKGVRVDFKLFHSAILEKEHFLESSEYMSSEQFILYFENPNAGLVTYLVSFKAGTYYLIKPGEKEEMKKFDNFTGAWLKAIDGHTFSPACLFFGIPPEDYEVSEKIADGLSVIFSFEKMAMKDKEEYMKTLLALGNVRKSLGNPFALFVHPNIVAVNKIVEGSGETNEVPKEGGGKKKKKGSQKSKDKEAEKKWDVEGSGLYDDVLNEDIDFGKKGWEEYLLAYVYGRDKIKESDENSDRFFHSPLNDVFSGYERLEKDILENGEPFKINTKNARAAKLIANTYFYFWLRKKHGESYSKKMVDRLVSLNIHISNVLRSGDKNHPLPEIITKMMELENPEKRIQEFMDNFPDKYTDSPSWQVFGNKEATLRGKISGIDPEILKAWQ